MLKLYLRRYLLIRLRLSLCFWLVEHAVSPFRLSLAYLHDNDELNVKVDTDKARFCKKKKWAGGWAFLHFLTTLFSRFSSFSINSLRSLSAQKFIMPRTRQWNWKNSNYSQKIKFSLFSFLAQCSFIFFFCFRERVYFPHLLYEFFVCESNRLTMKKQIN